MHGGGLVELADPWWPPGFDCPSAREAHLAIALRPAKFMASLAVGLSDPAVVERAMTHRVEPVLGACAIDQIRQDVVEFVAVEVASLQTFRSWSDEGEHDQLMNPLADLATVSVENRTQVAMLVELGRQCARD